MNKIFGFITSTVTVTMCTLFFFVELPYKLAMIAISMVLYTVTLIFHPIMRRVLDNCRAFQEMCNRLINYALSPKFYLVEWARKEWDF